MNLEEDAAISQAQYSCHTLIAYSIFIKDYAHYINKLLKCNQ